MTLHTVSCQSDTDYALKECLNILTSDDSLILLGDGTKLAESRKISSKQQSVKFKYYVVDLPQRDPLSLSAAISLPMSQFVSMCATETKIINWY